MSESTIFFHFRKIVRTLNIGRIMDKQSNKQKRFLMNKFGAKSKV